MDTNTDHYGIGETFRAEAARRLDNEAIGHKVSLVEAVRDEIDPAVASRHLADDTT